MRTAWVEAGRVAGFGRAGEFGGMLMVSLAAEVRAAAPSSDMMEGMCILQMSSRIDNPSAVSVVWTAAKSIVVCFE